MPRRGGGQAPRKLFRRRWKNKEGTCRSVAARGFAREDVGSCHEIRLCVDIGRPAARRNASAAARKTDPGIAAPCSAKASASSAPCLRSSALDAGSVSRLANMSLARAFHTSPPSQNGTTAACRTRRHRTRHALEIYGLGSAYRTVRAGLSCGGRIGPPRPNRLGSACWGASEIGSDFSNGGLSTHSDFSNRALSARFRRQLTNSSRV